MKKGISLFLALALTASLAACSSPPAAPTSPPAQAPPSAPADGATEIIFWHATGGTNGELLEQMVSASS